MKISKNFRIEYAHRLPGHSKRCRFLHGHSGKIIMVFDGQVSEKTGMVYDFGMFDWLKKIIDEFDHSLVLQDSDNLLKYLLKGIDSHEIDDLRLVVMYKQPTAENICMMLADRIQKYLQQETEPQDPWFCLDSVSFEETEGNQVKFTVA